MYYSALIYKTLRSFSSRFSLFYIRSVFIGSTLY
nr:MAG TPA: hypothetical protein [Caudoviricetes sp.]